MIALVFYKLGAFFVRVLPEPASRSIARILANVQFILRRRVRRAVTSNLRRLLDCDQIRGHKEARRLFLNFAESIRLFLRLPYFTREELVSLVKADRIRQALAGVGGEKGFIIVTAHLGPWELGGAYLAGLGIPVNTVALDHPTSEVTDYFNRRRNRMGVKSHRLEGSFVTLNRALARGECVVLLIDRAYSGGRKVYHFLGTKRRLPESHLLLAARSGAPILVGAFFFAANGGFDYEVRGPYHLPYHLPRRQAMDQLQHRCLRDLEEIIRARADQWFFFQPLEDEE